MPSAFLPDAAALMNVVDGYGDDSRLRRAGFNTCVDSVAMLRDQIGQYRDARLLSR